MYIASPVFLNNTKLPKRFAKSGANEISPPELADMPPGASVNDLQTVMEGHILETAALTMLFSVWDNFRN